MGVDNKTKGHQKEFQTHGLGQHYQYGQGPEGQAAWEEDQRLIKDLREQAKASPAPALGIK